MIVGGAEHEIDFVTIRFPIRLQASFDRIHPALRQMASRRRRLDLNKHAERTDHDALRRLPGPSCYVDLFRERTYRFGAPSNSIFSMIFSYWEYNMYARHRQCDRLHNANDGNPIRKPLVFFVETTSSESIFRDMPASKIGNFSIDQINAGAMKRRPHSMPSPPPWPVARAITR
ncbi:hypothetical protein [Burkholderia pyrrocinia]|uniref:hypothetical protein n=1 Tax=Burkholderia pyrrocinia TaxID=60550 RepID=UPI00158F6142|nr:hypothetical protein [Burkholderia pyrrocinia]